MFLYWKTQCCEDDRTPQTDLQIEHNPSQSPSWLFVGIDSLILKFIFYSYTELRISKTILKKNKLRELILLDFKTDYKAAMTKVLYCHKDRHIEQWSRIENPDINPYKCVYGFFIKPIIFQWGCQDHWGRRIFSIDCAVTAREPHTKEWG